MIENYELLEEVNLLFEMIKTMLITGLPQSKITPLLTKYTHYEIRRWTYSRWKFRVDHLVRIDDSHSL